MRSPSLPFGRLPLLVLHLAVVLLASSPSLAQEAYLLEGRVRVSHGIRHDGFLYNGKHWLGGTLHSVSADSLVLWTSSGGGFLSIPAGWITELQARPAEPPPDSPLAALACLLPIYESETDSRVLPQREPETDEMKRGVSVPEDLVARWRVMVAPQIAADLGQQSDRLPQRSRGCQAVFFA